MDTYPSSPTQCMLYVHRYPAVRPIWLREISTGSDSDHVLPSQERQLAVPTAIPVCLIIGLVTPKKNESCVSHRNWLENNIFMFGRECYL